MSMYDAQPGGAIQGIPQLPLNGGLPYLGIGTLSGLGGAGWLPGNRFSDTEQMTENLTKIYGKHAMKGGAEFQYIYFPWIAPPATKGTFHFEWQLHFDASGTDGQRSGKRRRRNNWAPYFGTSGNSSYNALQTKWVHQASRGLDLLLGYTLGQAITHAGDSLSDGGVTGYRAPGIVGIKYDTGLAGFNITHAIVTSGTYQLPFGRGNDLFSGMNRAEELILGGWSVNTILTLDSGQPQISGSQVSTGSGVSANAAEVPRQSKYRNSIRRVLKAKNEEENDRHNVTKYAKATRKSIEDG